MKRTYAFILAGGLLMSTGLYSCTSENTTGVETGTNGTDAAGTGQGTTTGGMGTQEPGDVSPLDTAQNAGSGNMNDTTRNSGTTSPTGSQ